MVINVTIAKIRALYYPKKLSPHACGPFEACAPPPATAGAAGP